MSKNYVHKKFCPIVFPEWGELFGSLSECQKGDILLGITMFPNYEPTNNPIWPFIKSQIQNQFDAFNEKCQKNGEIIRSYWEKKGNERLTNDNERLTNDNEGKPKPEPEPEPESDFSQQKTGGTFSSVSETKPSANPWKRPRMSKEEYLKKLNEEFEQARKG